MFDTIIVGAGAIGMMTAQLLSQQGQSVCLLDKADVGSESSWAGGGILSPLYPWRYADAVNDLSQWSQQHYPEFISNLTRETGIDSEILSSGLLIRNIEDQRPEIVAWMKKYNRDAQFVSASEAHEIEPLTSDIKGESLWLPNVGQVRNPRFVKALHQLMKNSAISIKTHCEVLEIKTTNNKFSVVQTTAGAIAADNLIVASGAWSGELLKKLAGQQQALVDVNPVRGQMMILKTPPDTLKRIILDSGHYLIPRKDGRVLIGSTLEFVGFDKNTTQQAHDKLLAAAISIVPSLSHYPVEYHWAGLRPGTADGIPYICKHPEVSGIYINTGHYRNGIIMGLASAQLLVNIMLDMPKILDTTAFECQLC